MKIKLLIADVDGTLVTSKKALTARTCEAVDRLRAAGVQFTITSGRPPRGMGMLVGPLKLTAPVAAFNGGMYVRSDLTTVLAQRTLPPAVAREVVDYLLLAGLDVWVYQGTDWFLRDPGAFRVAREKSNVGFEPVVIGDLNGVLEAPVKIVGVSQDRPLVARCEAELSARLGADASAARSTPFYLDVTHPEANKGTVVREAARLLQIPLDEIATIGDMLNDIPMLTAAGLSIAMGNASPEVQRVARHVTTSNEEDGFAHAVDAFILGEPPIARTPLGLPPRTRACLFGLDGVLTQTAKLHAEACKRLFDHYVRYIHAARAAGLRTAVVSSSTHCQEALESAGIAELFDARIDGTFADAAHLGSKPAPDTYLAAARAVGVDSEEAVVFEDELAGVEAGRAGHFGYVVGVDRLGLAADLRRHGADIVVPDLTTLLAS
jgi:Cof subfamily protein (haloacid dehalogenase superfamily)